MKNAFVFGFNPFAILLMLVFLTSCYSVRIKTVAGTGMPDPLSERTDYYRDFKVVERDTVIKMGKVEKDFTLLIKECEAEGLYTVEYRNTFGGILLSGITFGRRRLVKLKYVCIKPLN